MLDIQEILRTSDSFAAIEQIQSLGTPPEIAARYQSLLMDLYWKAHDLPALLAIGRAGISYCLGQSVAPGVFPEIAGELRNYAKSLAFNLGSFTWPGWQEPGINPTSDDLVFGRDCARLNLRLAIELKRPPQGLSKAHWLVGAHALSSRDFDLAQSEFELAQSVLPANDATIKPLELCNQGYVALARLCKNRDNPSAQRLFEDSLAQLRQRSDDDCKEYESQLISVRDFFVRAE